MANNNQATVYVTTTCPYCKMMTNYLQENNISYQTVNVQEDQKEAERLVRTTGQQGVPQTNINGQWIIGFDPDAVETALNS